jgi:hypothetical protein
VQYSLLERPVPSPETLATLMARLGALVGETRCGSPQILDTHRPDGWSMKPVSFADTELVASGFSRKAAADVRLPADRIEGHQTLCEIQSAHVCFSCSSNLVPCLLPKADYLNHRASSNRRRGRARILAVCPRLA